MKKISLPLLLVTFFLVNTIQAQVASSLIINDTRTVNEPPNFLYNGMKADFKSRAIIGVPGEGTWSTNLTLSPWTHSDNSGDKNHQLNFNNGGIFYRNAYPLDPQWGMWRKILLENENGNVGIGKITPSFYQHGGNNKVLEVNNTNTTINSQSHIILSTESTLPNTSIGSLTWALPNAASFNKGVAYIGVATGPNSTSSNPSSSIVMATREATNDNWKVNMMISDVGNVGIGTLYPTAKLTVAGDINSREVRVTVNAGADFVFENDYDLPSLNSVETFIKENKHLPEIASAKEMQKDGINLSEMNIKLLQKIEELTLYSIAQEKKINTQAQEIESLKNLALRVTKIENELTHRKN